MQFNINEFITSLFQIVIIPLLGVLVYYFKVWISAKAEELKTQTDNELYWKYIDMLKDSIVTYVASINQTYVDELKKQGKFDIEAQKEAFKRVYDGVIASLSEDAYKYLHEVMGDLESFIINQIEATVKDQKEKPQE